MNVRTLLLIKAEFGRAVVVGRPAHALAEFLDVVALLLWIVSLHPCELGELHGSHRARWNFGTKSLKPHLVVEPYFVLLVLASQRALEIAEQFAATASAEQQLYEARELLRSSGSDR